MEQMTLLVGGDDLVMDGGGRGARKKKLYSPAVTDRLASFGLCEPEVLRRFELGKQMRSACLSFLVG